MSKYVTPQVGLQSFNCPHCGANSHQTWYVSHSRKLEDNKVHLWDHKKYDDFVKDKKLTGIVPPEQITSFFLRLSKGDLFLHEQKDPFTPYCVANLFFSECYSCNEISLWMYDKLLYPPEPDAEEANLDMPADILKDYNEARVVLKHSPRGAAALLRLCVEKLCIHLNAKGKKLDQMIGYLVEQGLNVKIQKALDSVRVIGNEAVHPGQISLNDNKKIARVLFKLVNQIVDELITKPKELNEIYNMLPDGKKEGIENRDKKKKAS